MPGKPFLKFETRPTLKEVKKRHKEQLKKLRKTNIPNKKIAIFLDGWVQRNFKTEGGKVGGWQEFKLKGRWVGKGKRRRFDASAKLLQDTGLLKHSFLPFSNKDTAGIGSDVKYSPLHEEGEDNMPQRRMLPKISEVRKHINKIYLNHVKQAFR